VAACRQHGLRTVGQAKQVRAWGGTVTMCMLRTCGGLHVMLCCALDRMTCRHGRCCLYTCGMQAVA
jgi:hypothetical protein